MNAFFSIHGAGRSDGGWIHDSVKADVAKEGVEHLQNLAEVANLSKLRARDPESFHQYIESSSEHGPLEKVYIDGSILENALHQSGVTEDQLKIQMPSIASQIELARESGSDVEIPIADFATHIAGTDIQDKILDHVRIDPNGMTYAEGQKFYSDQEASMKIEAENIINHKGAEDAFVQSAREVHDNLYEQIKATGRYSDDVSKANATMLRDFYVTNSHRMGITPSQMFAEHPVHIGAEDLQGGLSQGGYDVTGTNPEDFITANNSHNLGEISPEIGALIKRQSGQIRLNVGEHHADNTGYGKAHIELRHGKQIKGLGFDSVESFVTHVLHNTSEIWQAKAGQLLLVAHDKDHHVMYLKLQPEKDASGDYYRINSTMPVRNEDYASKKGMVQLWKGSEPTINASSKHPEFVANPNEAGKDNPNAYGQSSIDSMRQGIINVNSIDKLNQSGNEQKDLIAQHNLTSENLLHAVKVGGLPVPSLAVTKKTSPLHSFGEITLLAHHKMVDPKGYAKTKVFGSDIYSPRYPEVTYKYDKKVLGKLHETFNEAIKATGERSIDDDRMESNPHDALRDNTATKYEFLKSQGIEPKIVYKKPDVSQQRLLNSPDLKPFITDKIDPYELSKNKDYVKAYISELLKQYKEAGLDEINKKTWNEEQQQNIAKDGAYKLREAVEAGRNIVDRYDTKKAIDTQFTKELSDKYQIYIDGLVSDLNADEKIYTGRTATGNKKYIDHTLQNVVKILKKELRGGESWNYGLGSVRSKYTPEFKSIAEIRKNKDRLMDSDSFEDIKNDMDSELEGLAESIRSFHPAFADSDRFGFLDSVTSMLDDAAKSGIPKALKDGGFENVPEAKMKEIAQFMEHLRNMPTEYFEAKILRDVDVAEFSGAVVPDNIRTDALDALKAKGITDIKYYKEGDELSRKQAIGQFEHLFFQDNRGAFDPKTSTIALLKAADLSTFHHEAGHFF